MAALITEASGRIRPDTAPAIAKASGVDLLSVGWPDALRDLLDIGLDWLGPA